MRGLLTWFRLWREESRNRVQRWETAMTPDLADPDQLAPVQRLLERELVSGVGAAGFDLRDREVREVHSGSSVKLITWHIVTGVTVWAGCEMAGIEAPGLETRLEAQGFLTPEAFCAAVVNRAVTESRKLVGLPIETDWTNIGIFGLIAAIVACVILFLP